MADRVQRYREMKVAVAKAKARAGAKRLKGPKASGGKRVEPLQDATQGRTNVPTA